MDEATRIEADRRFEEALEATGARDPRDFYRAALRHLKEGNPEGYTQAVDHYQNTLCPSVASGEAEPLRAWREYGRLIAEMTGPGRTVAIDETGRSDTYSPETPLDRMVLHLPEQKGSRGIVVALPASLSPAQKASYDLLVQGKQRLQG
jgi:hypothetical protein